MQRLLSLSRAVLPKQQLALQRVSQRGMAYFYTADHEYADVNGKVATCGITDFAQTQLGDVVYVSLPAKGAQFKKGDVLASVESVKAASDVYAPVSGTVVEVNEEVVADPAKVNQAAQTTAWFVKMELSNESEVKSMMNDAAYAKHCEEAAHH